MQDSQIISKYADRFRSALADPVQFARDFLNFQPYDYQVNFLRDQSPRIAACCGRQVGKTTLAAIKALHFALSHQETLVIVVSKGLRQSIELFDKILDLIDVCLPAKKLQTYGSRTKVRFSSRSEIIALPCGRDGSTLRGLTVDLAIIDEANWVPPIVIESVIRPMLITRPNGRIIMISTPWMKDHPFYQALNNAKLGFNTYTWPTSMNPKVSKENLELERLSMGQYDFNREFNAIFLDDEFAYFPSSLVLKCTDYYKVDSEFERKECAGEFYVGIDFGKVVDHSAIIVLQKISANEIRLVYMKEFKLNTSYKEVIAWVRKLNETYHFKSGYLDKTGVGTALHEDIVAIAPRIAGLTLTSRTKLDLMEKLKLAMENSWIIIPRDRRLLTQITSQQCKPTGTGNLQFSHPNGANDDLLWALSLAFSAVTQISQLPIIRWAD